MEDSYDLFEQPKGSITSVNRFDSIVEGNYFLHDILIDSGENINYSTREVIECNDTSRTLDHSNQNFKLE
jgi:hypothetical protein